MKTVLAGGPDWLSIGAAEPQEDVRLHPDPSCTCGTPIVELSGRPAVADVLGDWREEIITRVPGELRIYTTTIPATDRRVYLMQVWASLSVVSLI